MSESIQKVISFNLQMKRKLAIAIADRCREDSPVDELFKNADIKMAPWISERSDDNKKVKYVGQPYWTKAAMEHYKKNGIKGLRHEHAVPQKIIVEQLKISEKTEATIFSILDNLVHAVIVTQDEATKLDQKWKTTMPLDIKISNEVSFIFARYIDLKMAIYYVENGNPKKLVKKPVNVLSSYL